jgi:phosphohistidine phosphatase
MKTICLIRHAKTQPAGWQDVDFDRKLTDRGKEDARKMAMLLKEKGILPDRLISSTAKRTKKTAEIFAKILGLEESSIQYESSLYAAEAHAYLKTLLRQENDLNTIAVFGHNPGITDFANQSCEEIRLDHMPTASVFIFQSEILSWNQLAPENCQFKLFLNPTHS